MEHLVMMAILVLKRTLVKPVSVLVQIQLNVLTLANVSFKESAIPRVGCANTIPLVVARSAQMGLLVPLEIDAMPLEAVFHAILMFARATTLASLMIALLLLATHPSTTQILVMMALFARSIPFVLMENVPVVRELLSLVLVA
jgi:hypothetical protein